jgi:photosynthetic reaction center cytochrome c subunit
VKAWHGIRMARDVNNQYIAPLTEVFPANRKGVLGDLAKVNCATCHQGVNKPLLGTSMLKDYPSLASGAK